MKEPRLTREQFELQCLLMGIEIVIEETYHDLENGSSYVQWEFSRGFRWKDGEINWNKQLARIKEIRKANKKRNDQREAVLARGGDIFDVPISLDLPKWVTS